MKVRFKVNLGSMDAATCDVDFRVCVVDAVVEVNDQSGKWLLSRGIATEVEAPKPQQPEPVVEVSVVQEPLVEVVPEVIPEQKPEPVVETKPSKGKHK